MKVKLLKQIRKNYLIQHSTKGTALFDKDFSSSVLIGHGCSTWTTALIVRHEISDRYLDKHIRRRNIRNNKRVYNSDKYSLNATLH